ncbi:hypothetical protein SAMN05720606_102302 [Paenibacillus polysaccharolyticus]|uniref:Uncharacterized protein n=1 Tax=Paenibacillus polysaccharolyticus TaxID=582692 RepID=A0A1G5D1U6_9BACL|nr:hypothetical protein SAMN05720606_102302 [Paenibacillus polysaccharolyticus]
MNILYCLIAGIILIFVIRAIVHSQYTHKMASKMNKQFKHNFNEDTYHKDQQNESS